MIFRDSLPTNCTPFRMKCVNCWMPVESGDKCEKCQPEFKEIVHDWADCALGEYEDAGVSKEHMREVYLDMLLPNREKFQKDLEKVEKMYTHPGGRNYILDRNDSFKLLFKCIKAQDMTEFYPIYEKATAMQREVTEEAIRNAEASAAQAKRRAELLTELLTREEYSRWLKAKLFDELKRVDPSGFYSASLKKTELIDALMRLKDLYLKDNED